MDFPKITKNFQQQKVTPSVIKFGFLCLVLQSNTVPPGSYSGDKLQTRLLMHQFEGVRGYTQEVPEF